MKAVIFTGTCLAGKTGAQCLGHLLPAHAFRGGDAIGTPGVVSVAREATKWPLLLILVAVSMWTLSRTPMLKVLVRKA